MSDLGKEYRIAGVTVRKVQEQYLRDVPPSFLYPNAKSEEIKVIEPRLAEIDMDEDRDTLVVSIHSWLVKTPDHVILIDTGSGNDKERPRNPSSIIRRFRFSTDCVVQVLRRKMSTSS
ncbi:hypothetical protein [Rhizobium leguminosarum]|uniref:hypothetical protein n=1 Tax=Rhizobium leguminosarum TaxID=384 RepID=UPI0021BBDBC4|nr:hypothetical protein [Rhizobium leguminosarum]